VEPRLRRCARALDNPSELGREGWASAAAPWHQLHLNFSLPARLSPLHHHETYLHDSIHGQLALSVAQARSLMQDGLASATRGHLPCTPTCITQPCTPATWSSDTPTSPFGEHLVASRLAWRPCMRLYSSSCGSFGSPVARPNKRPFIVHTSSLFMRLSTKSVTPWLPTVPCVLSLSCHVPCLCNF
jgi:hypothetical protein